MPRSVLLAALFVATLAAGTLPQNAIVYDLVSGPSGTLYAAGAVDQSGFIAQLPNGFFYRTTAPVNALAISADGSVFATGTANSDTFPSTYPSAAKGGFHAFVIKLDSTGAIQYARLVDAVSTFGIAIAIDSAGEALVSGNLRLNDAQAAAAFPATPGAVTLKSLYNYGFVSKLDSSGRNTVNSILGYGGGPVAFDAAGNMYVTGQLSYDYLSPTSGAFEPAHLSLSCGGTNFVGSPCSYGYLVKISPDATQLLYSTYLTGQYGSLPSSLFVDPAGNAIVVGTTASHDYPVTPGAFQAENRGSDGPSPAYGFSGAHIPNVPPPTAGVISKINADGTGLLWSTYFGGSGFETISKAQLDSESNVVFTGLTGSPDLPGSTAAPSGCSPSYLRPRSYVAKLSADGSSILKASYIDLNPQNSPVLGLGIDGSVFLGSGNTISNVSLNNGASPACLVDAADLLAVDRIAPNQLLTIFTSLGTTTPQVLFNGVAGDVLYSGPDQINVRVPEDLTGTSVLVSFNTPSGSVTRALDVVTTSPAGFVRLAPTTPLCGGFLYPFSVQAIARNADGNLNSCAQPALSGSVITFFLNGIGNSAPDVSIRNPTGYGTLLSVDPDANAKGVWRVQVRLDPYFVASSTPPVFILNYNLMVNGQALRENLLAYVVPLTGL